MRERIFSEKEREREKARMRESERKKARETKRIKKMKKKIPVCWMPTTDDKECKWMLPMNESKPSEKPAEKREKERFWLQVCLVA